MYKSRKIILTAGPSITNKEIKYVNDAVINGWNKSWNKYLIKFENNISKFLGTKFALTTSSATGAMHLALLAIEIKKGDEIIIPEISWIATASVIKYVGAIPVFCEIDYGTWCIDTNNIEKLITNKTKAIMPVHIYGQPSNMSKIIQIAKKYNLKIIEDAAPSLGAKINTKKTGTFGDFGCFSFQGAKMLTTGEGGMLVTDNQELFKKAKFYSEHGRDPKSPLDALDIGYKYKMSNLQAALGCAQLERINILINKKRLINLWYNKRLNSLKEIQVTKDSSYGKSVHWMTSIELIGYDYKRRREFINKLKENNIDSRPVFSQLSSLPMFKTNKNNYISRKIGSSAINLPSGHNLSKEQINYICDIIIKLLIKK